LFTDSLYREVRRIIIASVLHTDMSHHFKMVSQMEVFYELHSEGIAANTRRVKRGIMVDCIYKKEEDRQFLLNVILHAADISNPVKPLDNYGKWSDRVIKEFFEQGDVERELGLTVSPMMDSATVNLAMSQINFIEFVVAPLYAVFGRLFPETSTTLARLVNNRMHYQALLEMELDDDDFSVSAASNFGSNFGPNEDHPTGRHAGEGKTREERVREKASMRARFRGMVEKHRLRHGAAGHLLNDSPPFQILMDAGAGAEPLRTSMTLEIDGALRRRSMDGADAGIRSVRGSSTSSTTADGRSRMNSCTSFD
jgi:cAMP-specific phosphodiesterase 4|tara:strand:- start:2987 stop:3919 length:933 start_codon:yes stop_codon:yes gene_type:complete